MNIENELKQLNNYPAKPQNSEFEVNLRKRLINEYTSILDEKISPVKESSKKSWLDKFVPIFRAQSAFHLSLFFLFMTAIVTVGAAFVATPSVVKEEIIGSISNDRVVDIKANIENASVYVNGEEVGTTPLKYRMKDGNYAIRVEKDGYGIYSKTISVSEESIDDVYAILLEKQITKENDVFAGWLNYENEDLDFSFKYPGDWIIEERFNEENLSENFIVAVSGPEGDIKFIANPVNDFELDKNEGIETYKRDINVNKREDSRYLQFDEDGDFENGGMTIPGSENRPDIAIIYDFNGVQSDILKSVILTQMDYIAQSLVVNASESIIAFDEGIEGTEDLNVKVDLGRGKDVASSIEKIPTPNENENDNGEVSEYKIYTNTLYGYKLKFNEDSWDISASRADYPLENRGFNFSDDQDNDFTVSRLKLRPEDGGEVSIFMTNRNHRSSPSEWSICRNDNSEVIKTFGEYELKQVSDGNSEFKSQLCKGDSGTFVHNSSKNGEIKYSIFWDEDGDLSDELFNQFKGVIESIEFDERLIEHDIDGIKYDYADSISGLSFEYRHDWTVSENWWDCIDYEKNADSCKVVEIFNRDGDLVLAVMRDGESKLDKASYKTEDLVIKSSSDTLYFTEYYEKECDVDGGLCSKGNLDKAKARVDEFEVIYYISPSKSQNMKQLISSISIVSDE